MFPAFLFSEAEILAFVLVLLRVIAFLISWPLFSAFAVPNPTKILVAIAVAFVLFPTVNRSGVGDLASLGPDVYFLAMKETFVGVCLGFMCRLTFFAVAVGGNLISTSIGMANAQIFNPALGNQSTTIEQFYMVGATLLFLGFNGHHIFLTGLAQSFQAVPLSPAGANLASFGEQASMMQAVLTAGIKIAAPVMIAAFVMNMAMGIIGRAVPQINVLVTSLPVNVLAGLMVMILAAPAFAPEMERVTQEMSERLFAFMKTL
jgi:flagellar biosynthetic protein FliR